MRFGHSEAQNLFKTIGIAQGYIYKKTWTKQLPTDGIWLASTPLLGQEFIPVAALEVANSESPKVLKGSLSVLCEVSPALGILVIQDQDIRRRIIKNGETPEMADQYIERKFIETRELVKKLHQRIEVWSFAQLVNRYKLATESKSFKS